MSTVGKSTQLYSTFSPTSIPGCALWLDAADRNSLVLSGSNVTQWNDKSGNGNNPTFGINKPTYTNGYVITANQNQSFTVPAATVSTASGGSGSLFFVFGDTQTQAGGTYAALFGTAQPSSNFYQSLIRADSLNYAPYQGNASFVSAMNTTNTLLYNNNYTFGSTVGSVGVNGTIYVSSNVSPQPSGAVTISGHGWGGDGNVRFYEIVFFTVILTVAQRQQIEGYLARKWGLTADLSASHPYKIFPPFLRQFSPLDVPGCGMWLDAADSTTFTLVGSKVSQWRDKSGSANNAFEATDARRPTYDSNNNRLFFNSGSNQLQVTGPAIRPTNIFIVANTIGSGRQEHLFRKGNAGSADLEYILRFRETDTLESVYVVNATTSGTINQALLTSRTDKQLISMEWDNSTMRMYQDGSQLGSNVSLVGQQRVATSGATNLRIGAVASVADNTSAPNASLSLNGYIYEILFYNRMPTTTERQQIESYLADKWGLQSSFPAPHPFKFSRALTVPFNPVQISGCALWLDAADSSTLTLSGSNVTQWNDKSGNGRNATPFSGPPQPIYSSSTRSISFNGSNGFNTTYTAPLTTETGFVVATPTTGNTLLGIGNTSSGGRQFIGFSTIRTNNQNIAILLTGGSTLPNNTTILYQFVKNTTTLTHYANGSLYAGPTSVGNYASSGTTSIGIRFNSGSPNNLIEGIAGTISEIITYSSALTSTERQQVEGYLAWKWGLRTSLPTTHPYYKFNPS